MARALLTLLGLGIALVVVLALVGDEEKRPPASPPATRGPALRVYASLPAAAPPTGRLDDVTKAVGLAFEERGDLVGRHRVELVELDSNLGQHYGWEAGRVTENARRAARDDAAVAYIGEIGSGASMISAPHTNRVGLLQVAPAGGYVGLTRPGGEAREPSTHQPSGARNFVRVWPGDHLEAAAAAQWMRRLKTRRLVVVDGGESLDHGVSRLVAQEARDAGIKVKRLSFAVRRLATIRDAAADAAAFRADTMVFTGIWQNRAAALWGRMHRANPSMRLIGSQHVADTAFTRGLLRSARRRTYLTRPELPPARKPQEAQAFSVRFERRYGHLPHPWAAYGYEAAQLVLDTIARAPAGAPALVRRHVLNEVFATHGREGIPGGRYSIDAYGDVTRARFGGYRVDNRGNMIFERVLVAGTS